MARSFRAGDAGLTIDRRSGCGCLTESKRASPPSAFNSFPSTVYRRTREKALAALRKLTWSDQLPVTLLDDTAILGTDYKALVAILGPTGTLPPPGNSQHRHGIDEPSGE